MNGKIVAVQYLRALAAVLVLASHALLYPLVEENLAYGRLGWLGVILFFVISGFIMVSVTDIGRFDGGQFFRRRIQRVVPLYWGFTILAAVLALIAPQLFKTTTFDGSQLALSLAFIPFYNAASEGLHPLYKLGWTLNYEMFFYACFALLAMLTARWRVVGLTLAYGCLALLGFFLAPKAAIPQFYMSFLPLAFVAGCWIGLLHIEGQLARVPRFAIAVLGIVGLAGLLEGFAWDRGLVEDATAFIGLLAFSGAMVVLALRFEGRLPRLTWLENLGNASYSIYLVHIFAVAVLAGFGLKVLGPNVPGAVAIVTVIAIAGGLWLGLLMYRYVELPLMKRLRGSSPLDRKRPRIAADAVDHGDKAI
jgi:exopolysaccharide production protein ExoZ